MENDNSSVIGSSLFEKKKACDKLIKESTITKEFYFFLIAASFLAAVGTVINNIAIVIGAMLIAPLLSPFFILGLGVVILNVNLVVKKAYTALKAISVSVFTAFIAGLFLNFQDTHALIRTNFMEFFLVSFIAGLVGTYIWVKSDLQNMASGVLVAVTILPPLASLGVGLSVFNREVVNNSLFFFLMNVCGLLLGSIVMFVLFGFGRPSKSIEKTVEKKIEEYEKK